MATKIKEFYEDAPVGLCVLGREGTGFTVLYTNSAFTRMAGNPAAILTDPAAATLKKGLLADGQILEIAGDAGAGTGAWIKIHVQDGAWDGHPAVILWATDISANKAQEETLRRAVAAADEAADIKSNFLATMSHEIRTPMQSVYGLLELIGEEKPDPRIRSMVDTAKTSASGLLEILDDILDFAKMDANKMELDSFEVPVRTLVRGINEAMAVKIHGDQVTLQDDIAQDVPFVVTGDPKRLRQILMNLTGNALKFTRKGSVTTRVKRLPALAGDNALRLRFEVADTGIGMKPEICERLFSPFTQADSSTSRKYGGTGLGLSICKKLVELMGGRIGVTSTEGQGSVFWFEIPTAEVSTAVSAADLPQLSGISVLSVEDHPQGAKEIIRSLESMGAKVESCSTYAEGLDLIKRRPFDVGVIDQGLPDGLGLDLIREIMRIRPYMGLVMYTVRDDIGLQYSLNSLGVTYLTKPASRRGLGEAVKDAARKTIRIEERKGSLRLLIAEDTESVRDVLRRQLEKLGVEADFVSNGREARDALSGGQYGILFTDLHMPEMDGYGLVEHIRKNETDKHFPVIVLTADVQMAQRQVYLSHGFDECLLKPVSLGHLQRLLIRWGLMGEQNDPVEKDNSLPPARHQQAPPALDIGKVREQMGAFDQDTVDMLRLFVDLTAPLVESLNNLLEHGDYHALSEAAHSLKGAARSACCNILGDLAAQLQDDAAARKDGCNSLVGKIIVEFDRAREEIKSLKL